jgi:hypothetical protein
MLLVIPVNEREAIQAKKCMARKTPESTSSHFSTTRSETMASRDLLEKSTNGRRINVAKRRRKAATDEAGPSASLINTAANDIDTTPSDRAPYVFSSLI